MEENRFSDCSKIQWAMLHTFRNEDDGCRLEGVFLHFLPHPEIYLCIEAFAKVGQLRTEED
jgi:hypothetical protein